MIVTVGGVVSTVHTWEDAAPLLPAKSVARTVNVWAPLERLWYVTAQGTAAPSRVQLNVEPASLEEKVKLAEVWFVRLAGPEVIVVCGGTVSTTHDQLGGVASTLPAGSVARTVNECVPSERLEYTIPDAHPE